MKKQYLYPEMNLIEQPAEDILTTSDIGKTLTVDDISSDGNHAIFGKIN